jgi:phosphohistidine phosphatase
MKRLVLCRHAKTETLYHGITDEQRELVPRGRTDAELVAKQLLGKGYKPGLIVTSHAARAKQTSVIIANTVGYPIANIQYEKFIYFGYTTADFLGFLATMDDRLNEIWVIGHNPDIAMLAMRLAQGDFSHFPTTAVAAIGFKVDSWKDVLAKLGELEFFTYPKELKS